MHQAYYSYPERQTRRQANPSKKMSGSIIDFSKFAGGERWDSTLARRFSQNG
jgi:hypothetical protein